MAEFDEISEELSDLTLDQIKLAKGLGGLIPATTATAIKTLIDACATLTPVVVDEDV